MESTELLLICVAAFTAVFICLTMLAVVMKLITVILPHREEQIDTTVLVALTTVVSSLYPGAKITGMKEIQ